LLHKDARLPVRTRPGDAAFDLSCLEPFSLLPGERAMVRTGVAIALAPGYAGLVLPRSGLAFRHGVTCANSPGLVDPNYRGELMVILINLGGEVFVADAGDRIAQLLLVPYTLPELTVVDSLSETERGADGFGSSGR
jgi:dUTP pyrophosphatase